MTMKSIKLSTYSIIGNVQVYKLEIGMSEIPNTSIF